MEDEIKNLTQEEIDELVENFDGKEKVNVDVSELQLLSQEEINCLMTAIQNEEEERLIKLEKNAPFLRSFYQINSKINEYENLFDECCELSPVEHGWLLAEGEVEEPYWGSQLTPEQKKNFNELISRLKKLPADLLKLTDECQVLILQKTSAEQEHIDAGNELLLRIAKNTIRNFKKAVSPLFRKKSF